MQYAVRMKATESTCIVMLLSFWRLDNPPQSAWKFAPTLAGLDGMSEQDDV
ncbi:MAG: hypothetical protein ACYDC6_03055 [Acidobacteriaceae bacterium]